MDRVVAFDSFVGVIILCVHLAVGKKFQFQTTLQIGGNWNKISLQQFSFQLCIKLYLISDCHDVTLISDCHDVQLGHEEFQIGIRINQFLEP